jgi:ubiquitin-protein ligase
MLLFRNQPLGQTAVSPIVMVAELRVRKDVEDLAAKRYSSGVTDVYVSLPRREKTHIIVPVSIIVKDFTNPYYGALLEVQIKVTPGYPFYPPEVFIRNKVYHPNVNIDSGSMLVQSLSQTDWLPMMTLNSIIFAIELSLIEPNLACVPRNPINEELAMVYSTDKSEFAWRVRQTLNGGLFFGNRIKFLENYGARNTLKRNREEPDWNVKKVRKTSDLMCLEECVHY